MVRRWSSASVEPSSYSVTITDTTGVATGSPARVSTLWVSLVLIGWPEGNRRYARRVAWEQGEQIVRREVWRGRPWLLATVVVVVEDAPELLVTYLPEEAPFAFLVQRDGATAPLARARELAGARGADAPTSGGELCRLALLGRA